jgi:hypothetical protein
MKIGLLGAKSDAIAPSRGDYPSSNFVFAAERQKEIAHGASFLPQSGRRK